MGGRWVGVTSQCMWSFLFGKEASHRQVMTFFRSLFFDEAGRKDIVDVLVIWVPRQVWEYVLLYSYIRHDPGLLVRIFGF